MFGGNWRENDVKNDVKIVILTSCMSVIVHPSCKTTFPSPVRVHGNPGRVCKKEIIPHYPHMMAFSLNSKTKLTKYSSLVQFVKINLQVMWTQMTGTSNLFPSCDNALVDIHFEYCIIYEPPHDKTNKMNCAPSKDSDQLGHLPSLISLHCQHEEALGPW